jgi:glycine/D-amino acid oxidase-like deaminating enzyme
MRIAVLGLGYIGATSMACLAKLGHTAVGVVLTGAVAMEPGESALALRLHRGLRPRASPSWLGA